MSFTSSDYKQFIKENAASGKAWMGKSRWADNIMIRDGSALSNTKKPI